MNQRKQSKQKRDCLMRLRQILETRFNEGELRTLCFDLDIEYDHIPGSSTTDKARELVAYLDRRNRVFDLVMIGERQRPDIEWPEEQCLVVAAHESIEEIKHKLPEDDGSLDRLIGALGEFGRFVKRVNEWKELHNILHDCITPLNNFENELQAVVDSRKNWSKASSYRLCGVLWKACQTPLCRLLAFGKTVKYIDNPVYGIASLQNEVEISLEQHDIEAIRNSAKELRDACESALYLADKQLRNRVGELNGIFKSIMEDM